MNLTDILAKNKPLRGIHSGKRCFIIANGPSLLKQDLTRLSDEVTIAVNSFFRHAHAKAINPKYWVIADPDYWQNPAEYLLPLLEGIGNQGINTKFFLPATGLDPFARIPRALTIEPHFFQYNNVPVLGSEIDFAAPIPPLGQNVVAVALMLAYYLGCNPIYLVGCDHDWWAWRPETYHQQTYRHGYPEPAQTTRIQDTFSFDQLSHTIMVQRHQYAQLSEFGRQKGFQVLNATAGGYLDLFPRVLFESLFPDPPLGRYHDLSGIALATSHELGQTALRLMRAGECAAALALLDAAIAQDTNRWIRASGLSYLRAWGLAELGLFAHAAVALDQAMLFSPPPESERDAIQELLDAWRSYSERSNELLGAVTPLFADKAAEASSEIELEALIRLGESALGQGDLRTALDRFAEAISLNPRSSEAQNNLGVLFWHLGEPERALRHFSQVIQVEPTNRDAVLNAFEILSAMGRPKAGLELLDTYLMTAPMDSEAQQLRSQATVQ